MRTAFAGAYGILTSTAYFRAGILSSRQHGRTVHLSSRDEPEDLSILSTVMGITQEVDHRLHLSYGDFAHNNYVLQTINHRKLVQELYDQKVLHSIVGVKPLPTVVKHVESNEKTSQSPSSKRQVVEDAWEEMRRNREYAYDESSSSRQHHRVANDDEEGGRYDIERHPPKKRRKTGRDHHPVIFVDDDDDEERHGYHDDCYSKDDEYDDRRRESRFDNYTSHPENPRNDRRRSYWLSKGIGPGSLDEEDTSY